MSSLIPNNNENNNTANNESNERISPDGHPRYMRDPNNIECDEYDIFYFVLFFQEKLDNHQKETFLKHLKNCTPCQNFSKEVNYSIHGFAHLTREESLKFLQFLLSPLWNKLEIADVVNKVKEQVNDDLGAIDFMLKRIVDDTSKRTN